MQKLATKLCLLLLIILSPAAADGGTQTKHQQKELLFKATKKKEEPIIQDWVAFGSGCKSSKEKPSLDVELKTSSNQGLVANWSIRSFELNLTQKMKGTRECALRLSVHPGPTNRISNIIARTSLIANKEDDTHLRAHLVLLLGDLLIARQRWDLETSDFAKHRSENFLLSSLSKTENPMPKLPCGKPQIIGFDYTFEGVRSREPKQQRRDLFPVWIKTNPDEQNNAATVEITFEECTP